jgi:Domain of unknown function (DUF5615)
LRFLLDQNVPQDIALVFQALQQEVEHTAQLGLQQAPDQEIAQAARDYDVLVTLDLHRQEAEWIAVNRAIVEHGVKVLRLRPPRSKPGIRVPSWTIILTIIRQLTYDMESWLEAFEQDAVLITISREEKVFRRRTRDEVANMLEQRRRPD